MSRPGRVIRTGGIAALLFLGLCAFPAQASDLKRLEDEFENAIKKVTPATVVCLPRDIPSGGRVPPYPSSGVMVSRKGLVLSDGDAGVYFVRDGKKVERQWTDKIEIRIPNLKGKGFRSYQAKVLLRNRDVDTSLIRIEGARSAFKFLEIGDSDSLQVGDFTFVMGSSFGLANEAPPTITAGVVSALVPFEQSKRSEGAYETIYTSAAVNPGVNGGPIVDADGRLIGTVSGFEGPSERFQFLGKCIPVSRLRAVYRERPESDEIFPDRAPSRSRSRMSSQLETVFHRTARKAYGGVVSFDVTREGEFSRLAPAGRGNVQVPRYLGSVSGVLIDDAGHVLTSLYNLTNITTLTEPGWAGSAPYDAKVGPGIEAIKSIRVHFPDGSSVPARVTGYSEYLGIAMLKADISGLPIGARPMEPAPIDSYQAGRFVLALGNPYGGDRPEDPLLTVGVLSKEHPITLRDRWAGHWQTDAGCTDANAGGAAVNLHGLLIGVINVWSPLKHGRNSGIGFVVPWARIEPHLEALKTGRKAPYLGVVWEEIHDGRLRITGLVEDGAAAKGGVLVGDLVLSLDGREVRGFGDAIAAMRQYWAGDRIAVRVRRGNDEVDLNVTLGARPGPKRPEPAPEKGDVKKGDEKKGDEKKGDAKKKDAPKKEEKHEGDEESENDDK